MTECNERTNEFDFSIDQRRKRCQAEKKSMIEQNKTIKLKFHLMSIKIQTKKKKNVTECEWMGRGEREMPKSNNLNRNRSQQKLSSFSFSLASRVSTENTFDAFSIRKWKWKMILRSCRRFVFAFLRIFFFTFPLNSWHTEKERIIFNSISNWIQCFGCRCHFTACRLLFQSTFQWTPFYSLCASVHAAQ